MASSSCANFVREQKPLHPKRLPLREGLCSIRDVLSSSCFSRSADARTTAKNQPRPSRQQPRRLSTKERSP